MKDIDRQLNICLAWGGINIFLLLAVCICGALSEAGYLVLPSESEGNMEHWVSLGIGIASSLIVSALVSIFTYKQFLIKAEKNIAAELKAKLESTIKAGQDQMRMISDCLNPSNSMMHDEHTELKADHKELRAYLQEAAKRQDAADARYGQLDVAGKGIVDAMRVLEGFSEIFQTMNSRVVELEQKVKELQHDKEQLQAQNHEMEKQNRQLQEQVQRDAGKQQAIDWTHDHGRADDMEFER